MRKVGSNTGGVDNIVESQLINMRARLQKQRQRLRKHKRETSANVGPERAGQSDDGSETCGQTHLANATRGAGNNY